MSIRSAQLSLNSYVHLCCGGPWIYPYTMKGDVLLLRMYGIFQGDSLSPLIFIIALNPLSLIINRRCNGYKIGDIQITHLWYMDDLKGFTDSYKNLCRMANLIVSMSRDIDMEFGLSKCKCINIIKGKHAKIGGIQLQSGGTMEELSSEEFYKYLGIEELETIKHEVVKDKVAKNVKSKLRKLLETELNARNLFQAINESILPPISYSFGIVNWTEEELKGHDTQIRKMLHMYRVFQLKSDIDRLYLPTDKGGRGLISVWDTFQSTTCRIAHAFTNTQNPILRQCITTEQKCLFSNLTRAKKCMANLNPELPQNFHDKQVMAQARIMAREIRTELVKAHENAYHSKLQHGAYVRLLEENEADVKQSMAWLRKCHIDAHTEGVVCAAQELAIITKYHQKHILKNSDDDKCMVCKTDPESIFHLLGACDVLAKREYFTRHNSICQYLHYKILKHY